MPVLVLIRTALRADADPAAYQALGARMDALVATIPGYLGARSYTADDGDELTLVRFADAAALAAWRDHPDHREAQRRGRSEFYARYDVEVCEVVRAYDFTAPAGPGR